MLFQGSFGKYIFSRGVSTPDQCTILRNRQWKRRKEWQTKFLECITSESFKKSTCLIQNICVVESNNSIIKTSRDKQHNLENVIPIKHFRKKQLLPKQNELLVVTDSDDDCTDSNTFMCNLNPILYKEALVTVQEILYLDLEEAFFLCHALHCMTMKLNVTANKVLLLEDLWKLFINVDPNFVQKYVTYHYFRSRGWIVKSGINLGCDFGKI